MEEDDAEEGREVHNNKQQICVGDIVHKIFTISVLQYGSELLITFFPDSVDSDRKAGMLL